MKWFSSVLGVLVLVAYSYQADNITTDHNLMPPKDEMMGAAGTTAKPMGMMAQKIGDMCNNDMDCTKNLGDMAQCTNHMCACKSNYKPSSDMTKCNSNGAGYAFVSMMCVLMALVSKFVVQ